MWSQVWGVLSAPIVQTMISAILGGTISAGVALTFYRRSTRDLKAEAAALREETQKVRSSVQLLGKWLVYAKVIPARLGPDGDLQQLIVGTAVFKSGPASMRATATVTPPGAAEMQDMPSSPASDAETAPPA